MNHTAAEYATLALACAAAVNLCALAAVLRGRPTGLFEAGAGAGVALACVVTLCVRGTYFPRQVITTGLMVLWGARLSRHLFLLPSTRRSQLLLRLLWSMVCATPVVICNTRQVDRYRTTRAEEAAIGVALFSLLNEHLADEQKRRWYQAHAEAGRPGRGGMETPVCDAGWWSCSRHANTFFELAFHWAVYAIVSPVEAPLVVSCPIALTVLLVFFPGGVFSREIERQKKYALFPAYSIYRERTPVLFPLPFVSRALQCVSRRLANAVCLECVSVQDTSA